MSSRIYIEDIDVGKAFIVEWMKCLAGFEKEILKLEYHSEDIELLDQRCSQFKARIFFFRAIGDYKTEQ
jgi:hypothetical protein